MTACVQKTHRTPHLQRGAFHCKLHLNKPDEMRRDEMKEGEGECMGCEKRERERD